jgi:hypothetical protein
LYLRNALSGDANTRTAGFNILRMACNPDALIDNIHHALRHGGDHLDLLLIGWLDWIGWGCVRLPK